MNNAFAKGGEGAVDLANLVVDTIENKPSEPLTFTYEESDCVERKIEKVACNLYGASVVTYSLHSRKVIKLIEQMGIFFNGKPPDIIFSEDYARMLHAEPIMNYWLDILCMGNTEDKQELFMKGRKEVEEVAERVRIGRERIMERNRGSA